MRLEVQASKIHRIKSYALPKIPGRHILCFSLICARVLIGAFGRDPWKADEPYSFGIALNFLLGQSGRDWIVPYVGHQPFVEKPPLMYWIAAVLARLTDTFLSLQAGMQLAIPIWLIWMLYALFTAARRMYAGQHGLRACMLLLCTVGALGHTQKLIADLPQCTGAAVALAALVRFITEPKTHSAKPAGLLFGTGAGIAWMSKGMLIPSVLAFTSMILILRSPVFRDRRALHFFACAIGAALPWLLIWPFLFWRTSESLFIEWLWDNNFGRFFGFSEIAEARPNYSAEIALVLLAASFPSGWLAAAHTLRRWRTHAPSEPGCLVLWCYTAVFLGAVLFASSSFREVYALPVYPALALLAANARLPEAMERWSKTCSIFLCSVLGASLWFCWWALLTGHGPMLPAWIHRWLPLNYTLHWNAFWLFTGLTLSGLWLCAVLGRAHLDAVTIGFAGLTLVWGLLHTLLLPWLNEARSYRTPFHQFHAALPARYDCLAVLNLGESEQAMLHYFEGIQSVPKKIPARIPCQALLVLDKADERMPTLAENRWREFWRGGRMGDDNERFRAYLRQGNTEDSYTPPVRTGSLKH